MNAASGTTPTPATPDPVETFVARALAAARANADRGADTTFRATANPVIADRQVEVISALRRCGAHFELGHYLGNLYLTLRGDEHTRAACHGRRLRRIPERR